MIGITHRIHGAAIYGNMDPINIPPTYVSIHIPAPWILWVISLRFMTCFDISRFIDSVPPSDDIMEICGIHRRPQPLGVAGWNWRLVNFLKKRQLGTAVRQGV